MRCMKCQSSLIRLYAQPYRCIDSIIVTCSVHRDDYLYGRYQLHPVIPNGVEITVIMASATPIPPAFQQVFNLCLVGRRSDFTPADMAITATHQLKYPVRLGKITLGSRFIGLANEDFGYQVTDQGMSLLKHGLVKPGPDTFTAQTNIMLGEDMITAIPQVLLIVPIPCVKASNPVFIHPHHLRCVREFDTFVKCSNLLKVREPLSNADGLKLLWECGHFGQDELTSLASAIIDHDHDAMIAFTQTPTWEQFVH